LESVFVASIVEGRKAGRESVRKSEDSSCKVGGGAVVCVS